VVRTSERPGTATRYPRATSRGRRVRPGEAARNGTVNLTDKEGARLVARHDVLRGGAPAREKGLKNKNLKGNMIKSENPLDYLELIVLDLMNKEEGWHFLYPVEPEALGITDYFDKIKIPMDFSTILEKARQQNYKEIETFKNDILLIFQNATFYNSKGTEVHNAALALEEKFTNMYKMLENIRDNKNQKNQK